MPRFHSITEPPQPSAFHLQS